MLHTQYAPRPCGVEADFQTFTTRLIAFRKAHASLRPAAFYSGSDNNANGLQQLAWFTPSGAIAGSLISTEVWP